VGRVLPWIGGAVLVAGIVVAAIAFTGSGDVAPELAAGESEPPVATGSGRRSVQLDPQAKQVAADFISTAVARKDLRRSWTLTHPELREGYTIADWVTGTIPVQPYPVGSVETATFSIDESFENEAMLQVSLVPEKGSKMKGQIFFVGLKRYGPAKRWGVYYWASRGDSGSYDPGEGT